MKMPWTVKKKDPTPSDKVLEKVRDILFPKMELRSSVVGEEIVKYHVDFSADMNLDAVLVDLQDGHNDAVSQKTISTVIGKLQQVRELLEADYDLDKEAQYILVENESDSDPEIVAGS